MIHPTDLFSADVLVEQMHPRDAVDGLLPEETHAIARAVDKRRREYTAGRLCARRALARLGHAERPLLNGDDRAPIWPAGVSGSITHTDSLCLVAVAPSEIVRALGVDVELDAGLNPDLESRICTPREQAALSELDAAARAARGKLVFSAKECAYKCQYALSQTFLGFHAMEIAVDEVARTFVATFQQDAAPFRRGDTLGGRFAYASGVVATAVELRRMPA